MQLSGMTADSPSELPFLAGLRDWVYITNLETHCGTTTDHLRRATLLSGVHAFVYYSGSALTFNRLAAALSPR